MGNNQVKERKRTELRERGLERRREKGMESKRRLTVLRFYEVQELWREVVSKLVEGLPELVGVDGARVVAVEVAINVLPVLDVFPQSRELVEADRPATIRVLWYGQC